jgi:hypothetical protein
MMLGVDWSKAAGFRDMIVHGYFGLDRSCNLGCGSVGGSGFYSSGRNGNPIGERPAIMNGAMRLPA